MANTSPNQVDITAPTNHYPNRQCHRNQFFACSSPNLVSLAWPETTS